MKKLLLLTNLTYLCFGITSCHSTHPPTTEKKVQTTETTTSSVGIDTSKTVFETGVSGTIGNNKGIKKDTISKTGSPNAIIHTAPNQEKIDSIKNEKLKNKK